MNTRPFEIKTEDDFVTKLGSITEATPADLSLVSDEAKEKIEYAEREFLNALTSAPTDLEDAAAKEETFQKLYELKSAYRVAVKGTSCKVLFTKLELDTLTKLMHQSVEYTAETIYYGLHLKQHFLKTLPKTRDAEFNSYTIEINFTHATVLYHILSTLTVKGLNKDSYAFANILYTLAEVAKVSEHYNVGLTKAEQSLRQWFGGVPTKPEQELAVNEQPLRIVGEQPEVCVDEPTVEIFPVDEPVAVTEVEQEEPTVKPAPKKKGSKK